jgi:glycosyltransferase involved in cell wall biosynthesis
MPSSKPKISVIMPVYNGAKYLRPAIDSIIGQTFTDFEFIIINDGSTDSSAEIIKSYGDERLAIIEQQNQGVTKSLNNGLAIAKGEFIARMDADDIALPERLEKQLAFLSANPEICLCGSRAFAIDERGETIGTFDYPPISHQEIKKLYLWHNPFIHSSVMFRNETIKKLGSYDESIPRAQDYELWGRVIKNCQTANLPDYLLKYRVLKAGVTKSRNLSMRLIGLKIRLRYLFG